MPLIALVFGVLFIVAAVRDTLKDSATNKGLITLLKSDVTGPNNFLYWIAVVVILGLIGTEDDLKPLSNAFLVLFVIVILLGHKGFFSQLTSALQATQSVTSTGNANSNTQQATGQIEPVNNNGTAFDPGQFTALLGF